MRLKSSARYGLTVGGYNDVRISLTEAGRAAIAPKSEEERRLALVDCARRPDVFITFYESLDGKRLPEAAFLTFAHAAPPGGGAWQLDKLGSRVDAAGAPPLVT